MMHLLMIAEAGALIGAGLLLEMNTVCIGSISVRRNYC